jgi:hypothetical protein
LEDNSHNQQVVQ